MSGIRHNPSSSGQAALILHVFIPTRGDQELFVQHGLTIGRASSNPVVIPDELVDPIHARILRDEQGSFELVAESSIARLQPEDGPETDRLLLEDGARFRIGLASFVCRRVTSRSSVVITANPWEVRCPRCHTSLAEASADTRRCFECELPIQYFEGEKFDDGKRTFRGWLPRQVGPYKIRGFVGQGGMGVVLKGMHEEKDLPAAIKLPLPPEDGEQEWVRRFDAEIDTLRNLKHPNIVRLQEAGRDQRLVWLATYWIEGESLAHVIDRTKHDGKQLSIEYIRETLQQVLAGLQYLHEREIVHRDLKPANVLIAEDGLVKLTDFGLARAVSDSVTQATLTRTGSVVGTHGYMSPEQVEGGRITSSTDIYAFGVIWYEMLTGRRPMGVFTSPERWRGDCPLSWARRLGECLDADGQSRPTSHSLSDELVRVTADHETRCPHCGVERGYDPSRDTCQHCRHGLSVHPQPSESTEPREDTDVHQSSNITVEGSDSLSDPGAWKYLARQIFLGCPAIGATLGLFFGTTVAHIYLGAFLGILWGLGTRLFSVLLVADTTPADGEIEIPHDGSRAESSGRFSVTLHAIGGGVLSVVIAMAIGTLGVWSIAGFALAGAVLGPAFTEPRWGTKVKAFSFLPLELRKNISSTLYTYASATAVTVLAFAAFPFLLLSLSAGWATRQLAIQGLPMPRAIITSSVIDQIGQPFLDSCFTLYLFLLAFFVFYRCYRGLSEHYNEDNIDLDEEVFLGTNAMTDVLGERPIGIWPWSIAIIFVLFVVSVPPSSVIVRSKHPMTMVAENGNTTAMMALGYKYFIDESDNADYAEAVRWFRNAAEAEDSWGMFYLGLSLAEGKGVDKDPEQARAWIVASANKGNTTAREILNKANVNWRD